VKQLDHHFPAARPEAYLIRWNAPSDDSPLSPDMQQLDTNARGWLSGAEFSREVGNSLITNIEKVAQHTKAMTSEQLIGYGEAEYVKLQRVYGDTLEEKLNAAGRMIEHLDKKTTGLKNLLQSKGIGDNALVASLLIQQAERYWARRA
jgi:hypothetical protein